MNGSRARRYRQGRLATHRLCKFLLKGIDMWTERRDPISLKCVMDKIELDPAHVGNRKMNSCRRLVSHQQRIPQVETQSGTPRVLSQSLSQYLVRSIRPKYSSRRMPTTSVSNHWFFLKTARR